MRRFYKKNVYKFNYKKFSIVTSVLLSVSEALPFMESYKSNGLIDSLRKINQDIKELS